MTKTKNTRLKWSPINDPRMRYERANPQHYETPDTDAYRDGWERIFGNPRDGGPSDEGASAPESCPCHVCSLPPPTGFSPYPCERCGGPWPLPHGCHCGMPQPRGGAALALLSDALEQREGAAVMTPDECRCSAGDCRPRVVVGPIYSTVRRTAEDWLACRVESDLDYALEAGLQEMQRRCPGAVISISLVIEAEKAREQP